MLSLPWSALLLAALSFGGVFSLCYLLSKIEPQKEFPSPELELVATLVLATMFQESHVISQSKRASNIALIAGVVMAILVIILREMILWIISYIQRRKVLRQR